MPSHLSGTRYLSAARSRGSLRITVVALVLLTFALPAARAQYRARQDGDMVRLEDGSTGTVVSIAPSLGNLTFEMKVKGQNVLHFPFPTLADFKAHPTFAGIPFLAPWGNRLDEDAFYANGKKYNLNMTLGNVKGATPIHGFLTATPFWEIVEARADSHAAWLTCRLEFYRHPDWMEQFPFAHTIEITQRLANGVLEVQTRIVNLSTDPMPVAIGFHPYFQLTDSSREAWVISVGARTHWLLSAQKIPTGQTEPIERLLPTPKASSLKDDDLDDVFDDLVRDVSGKASFTVTGKHQKLEVLFGPNYHAAVVYSPNPQSAEQRSRSTANPSRPAPDLNFVCFEPMAGVTDAMNLAQRGLYQGLQSIPPGGTWQESFWIHPSGF